MKKYSYSFILLPGFTMDGEDMEYYENKIKNSYQGTTIKFIRKIRIKTIYWFFTDGIAPPL